MRKSITNIIQFGKVVGMLPWRDGLFAMIIQHGPCNDRYVVIGSESYPLGCLSAPTHRGSFALAAAPLQDPLLP